MSGFEALAAVCSILQVISFTKEVITALQDVYDGRPTSNGQMRENAASIQRLIRDMNLHSAALQGASQGEEEVFKLAQKCGNTAEELIKRLSGIDKDHQPGNFVGALKTVTRSYVQKKKISELSERFSKYQRTMESHVLLHVYTRANAVESQQRTGFSELSNAHKYFVSQLADGHTEMTKLILRDGAQTRQEIQQSEARMTREIHQTRDQAHNEAKRNRLLQSLKFASLNARRTAIDPVHKETYLSVFDSLDNESAISNSNSDSAESWKLFTQWLQSALKPDGRVFWIQGKPGAGKSTLVKYLIEHKNTRIGLNKWSNGALVIPHFFWKPGDLLQRNFRGLLCSLNHQLLRNSPSLVNDVLSEFSLATEADTINDWEITQLQQLFLFILEKCEQTDKSVLLVIDGLDEAEEPDKVLEFIDSLAGLHNIKLCISSRPETRFQQSFSNCHGFKLQDLTGEDMLRFADADIASLMKVASPEKTYHPGFLKEVASLLVGKAEGVYLWLVLALKSVKTGLINSDKEDDIYRRLEQLPSKLEELYADMWDRLGDSKDIYKSDAADYFSMIIMNHSLRDQYQKENPGVADRFEWPLNLFQVMLATNEETRQNMLKQSQEPSVSELEIKCLQTTKSISIRTAGLAVTRNFPNCYWILDLRLRNHFLQLDEHVNSTVEFIHRSLFDFFKHTTAGKRILSCGKAYTVEMRLASAILGQLRTLGRPQWPNKQPWLFGMFQATTPLHYPCWQLSKLIRDSGKISIAKTEEASSVLLHNFKGLFEAGLLSWDGRPEWYPLPCFEPILIEDPVFDHFLKQQERKGISDGTHILREFFFSRRFAPARYRDLKDMELALRCPGVDIRSACICLSHLPTISLGLGELDFGIPNSLDYSAHESIQSAVVKGFYYNYHFSWLHDLDKQLRESAKLLVMLLKRGMNLTERTSCLLFPRHSYLDKEYVESVFGVSDLLCGITAFENSMGKAPLSELLTDRENSHPFVIMEANLKYLVDRFLKLITPVSNDTMDLIIHARQLAAADTSKPLAQARFLVLACTKQTRDKVDGCYCYRFTNRDMPLLDYPDERVWRPGSNGSPKLSIKRSTLLQYTDVCERVNIADLSILADEKLGVCWLRDMGIGPPNSYREGGSQGE